MSSQFVRFLLTGGLAALVNIGARYLLSSAMIFEAAVVLAYVIGMVTAYCLSRLLVFQKSGRSVASEFKRFVIVNLFALSLVWLVSVGLARLLFPAIGLTWHSDDIAHLIGVLAPAVTSYLGHRYYTFARAEV